MAKVLISESYLTEIADAIRAKANTTNNYTPAQMGAAITNISTVNNQNKTVNSSTSQQTVTADSGYTGLGTVTINAIATTTHPNPTASINSSTGLVTASHTQTTGYVSAGTTTGTLQLSTQAAKTVTPSTSAQTAVAAGKYTLGAITVAAIPSQYIVPSGSLSITSNDTYDVTSYASVEVSIPSGVNNQSKTVTPTKSAQTVTPDSGYSGLSQVKVNAIPAAYITTTDADAVAANLLYNKTAYVNGTKITGTMANNGATGTTITTQGGTYTIPAGYTSGGTVTASVTASSVTNTIINGTAFEEETGDYGFRATVNIPAGYHNETTLTKDFSTILPAPDTEGTASQVLIGYDLYNHEGQVISGTMANNGTWNRTLSDSTTSVTIPAGYHSGSGKVNISTVAIPNPTISVSAAGVITASGTWTKGYTTNNSYSNTKTLTTQAAKTVSPTESEQTAVAANTYTTGIVKVGAISSTYVGSGIASKDSTNLTVSGATVTAPAGYYAESASKSVATMTLPTSASSSATSGYTGKATIGRSTSAQYINIPPGYNSAGGYYTISAVANGSVTAPSSISGTTATLSTGTNTITLTKTVSVTPNVTTAGYISSGTAGNSSVSLTANVTTKAAATYNVSTSNQTIAAGTYLTGAQTIRAVTHTATAAKIAAGQTVTIGDDGSATRIANINGTFTSDATATASDIVDGETAYVNGSKITGTLTFKTVYTGSSTPSSSLGENGDIYIQA